MEKLMKYDVGQKFVIEINKADNIGLAYGTKNSGWWSEDALDKLQPYTEPVLVWNDGAKKTPNISGWVKAAVIMLRKDNHAILSMNNEDLGLIGGDHWKNFWTQFYWIYGKEVEDIFSIPEPEPEFKLIDLAGSTPFAIKNDLGKCICEFKNLEDLEAFVVWVKGEK